MFARIQHGLLGLSALYALFLAALATPYFQSHAVFLHKVRWPLFADLSDPVRYGLPASRSTDLRLTTKDGVSLGAWLVLPPSAVPPTLTLTLNPASPFPGPPSNDTISSSLRSRPTILFFHGNAATRATDLRVQHVSTYAARFGANVLALDYRGFGDSGGFPTQEGLITDARAAWDWCVERGARAEDVLVVGLSLGTGVVTGLAAELQREGGVRPRGVVLLAPFTSIKELLTTYSLLGFIPILQPLQILPIVQRMFSSLLNIDFNTLAVLPTVDAPILIVHSSDDYDIPWKHSRTLFDAFIDPHLPPVPRVPTGPHELRDFDWAAHKKASARRRERRKELVGEGEIPGFATVHTFERGGDLAEGAAPVRFVHALWGGHNGIGIQESLVDYMAATFFSSSSP